MTDRDMTFLDAQYELYDRIQIFKAEMKDIEDALPWPERWIFRALRWICGVRYD